MKLFLTSYRIASPGALEELLGKPLQGLKVGFIPNAKDYYAELARNYKIRQSTEYLGLLGMQVSVLDLRSYADPAKLQADLSEYDLLWVGGGNTFCLRYEMRRSGFDTVIRDVLESGVAYGGESAGALVACTSIAGVESADVPEFAPDYITDGLGLVPHAIMPHVDNPEFTLATEQMRSLYGKDLIELTDAQALVVDGDNRRIVTGPAPTALDS